MVDVHQLLQELEMKASIIFFLGRKKTKQLPQTKFKGLRRSKKNDSKEGKHSWQNWLSSV